MSPVTEKAGRIWTDAELQALPDEGYIHEVIDGELAGRRGRSSRLHSAATLASETRY
jgi:hypothetical protein